MKKLAISLAITAALGLTGCDDTTLENVQQETEELRQETQEVANGASVAFDPGAGVVSLPNDLIFLGTQDFTLETPAEADAKEAGEAVDFSNPEAAIGALDGWGTQNTFTIGINYDAGVTLDAATVASGDAVGLYQVKLYPVIGDDNCSDATKAALACEGVDKLTWGEDYVTSVVGGDIAITPLKPLKGGASYVVALTKAIKDNDGDSLEPSASYASLEKDINEFPLVTDQQLALQAIYNSLEGVLARDFGADPEAIVHTSSFTVQSAGVPGTDPLQITKLLNAREFAAKAQSTDPVVQASAAFPVVSQGITVAQALVDAGAIANDPASLPYLLFNSANVYGGMLDVPYYLENVTTGDPLSGRWEAQCDSGVALQTLTAEQIGALEASVPAENEASHALCKSLGLANYGIDTERHLTKFNPLPQTKSIESIEVQVTLPNIDNANVIRTEQGLPAITERPAGGWPVVILQHGITSNKNDMLAATGFLSMFGFATVAIDHPLHASRGFTMTEGETTKVINAASAVAGSDPTAYLNLASLLTARDNLRQSVADTLKLRLALNGLVDATAASAGTGPIDAGVIDKSRVYYAGHSLGAITGTNFTAIANTPVDPALVADPTIEDEAVRQATAVATASALEALYKVNASFLANPGASIGNFLLESGSFGTLVKASVVAGLGNELTEAMSAFFSTEACQAAAAANGQNGLLVCAYQLFVAEATAEQQAGIAAGLQQFAFAAQAAIEAGDPTNYAGLLTATDTPVLMVEMVGDLDQEGGMNPSDQTIPNAVATNPLAGTTGLANQLGLPAIAKTTTNSTEGVSGIVRYTKGGHSTFLSPSAGELPEPYPTLFGAVNQEVQQMMSYFFLSDGGSIKISDDALCAGLLKDGDTTGITCN
ncbi:MAG: hypothetical protein HWE10_03585 [Gammaproteobacteria bacterium]|nr:hypothetical protein [Gammaproteobacteria bacterium]